MALHFLNEYCKTPQEASTLRQIVNRANDGRRLRPDEGPKLAALIRAYDAKLAGVVSPDRAIQRMETLLERFEPFAGPLDYILHVEAENRKLRDENARLVTERERERYQRYQETGTRYRGSVGRIESQHVTEHGVEWIVHDYKYQHGGAFIEDIASPSEAMLEAFTNFGEGVVQGIVQGLTKSEPVWEVKADPNISPVVGKRDVNTLLNTLKTTAPGSVEHIRARQELHGIGPFAPDNQDK